MKIAIVSMIQMGERKLFFIRNDGIALNEVRLWAGDELRSLNGQTEFILRAAVKDRGRLKKPEPEIERREERIGLYLEVLVSRTSLSTAALPPQLADELRTCTAVSYTERI